jgi:kynurenine formamidase
MSARWKQRPEGSNWGEFGADDERGRMNLVDENKVLQGMAEVKFGKTFCLCMPLDYPGKRLLNPRRFPPRLFSTQRGGLANFNFPMAHDNPRLLDVVCDDSVLLCLQYSTQWDSFAHVGQRFDADGDGVAENVFYNGWRGGEHIQAPSDSKAEADEFTRFEGSNASRLGIENLAEHGAQGRGVMIDLRKHFGDDRAVVGYDGLMRVLEADKVTVETGDMVCLYTGFSKLIMDMKKEPDIDRLNKSCAVLDGRDEKLKGWIRDSGLAVLIADSYGVEDTSVSLPAGDGPTQMLPLHNWCLFRLGIHLGEMFWLHDLAMWLREHGRSRFLLTAPPLNLPGAAGSPAAAVATV